MDNIIKSKTIEILKDLKASYTTEQETCILNIMNSLLDDNINITKVAIEHSSMFINHLLVLFSRLDSKEVLEMEYLDLMFAELKPESTTIARKVTEIVKTLYNTKISEAEVFLIATHIENISNQQQ